MEKTEARRADRAGREVPAVTRYGENAGDRVCGVVSIGLLGRWASVETRKHRWRIEKKCTADTKQARGADTESREMGEGGYCRNTLSAMAGRASHGAVASGSGFSRDSASYSPLGPVAITVRGPDARTPEEIKAALIAKLAAWTQEAENKGWQPYRIEKSGADKRWPLRN
jgi:hypothetical protein